MGIHADPDPYTVQIGTPDRYLDNRENQLDIGRSFAMYKVHRCNYRNQCCGSGYASFWEAESGYGSGSASKWKARSGSASK
jgi:hypothetical protein